MESIEQCEGMDMGEDIFMLVHNISPKSENRQALIEFIERVQGAIKETFSIGLTVAVSEKGLGLSSLKTLFHSAVDMIKQKMWYGNGSIFFSDSLDRKDDNTYKYPLVIEKRMEEALRLGRTADAMKNFDDLLWSAKGYSHQVYQSVITSNAVLVSRIVTQMPEGSITIHAKDSFLIIREGGTKETAEEVSQYFYQIFNEIREYANSVKQNKHNEIVEQTKKIIHEKYHDSSLCLKSIADQVELSPAYLGKIFKESTALAVLDYINSIRLEKSKLLLKDTQDTIQDIMMATGFLSSGYFYTQFKKVNAMTPSEYRHGLNKQNPHKLSK
jgi:YesN/AraC family two-component response regulator